MDGLRLQQVLGVLCAREFLKVQPIFTALEKVLGVLAVSQDVADFAAAVLVRVVFIDVQGLLFCAHNTLLFG